MKLDLTRTRVASDIDAVLCDLIESARLAIAEFHGVHESTVKPTWDYHVPFSHPDPEIQAWIAANIWQIWNDATVIQDARPIAGALDLIRGLHDQGRLACYVTRRSAKVANHTHAWLAKHGFPLDGVELHHVGDRLRACGTKPECKSVTALSLGADLLIDDSAHEAETALDAGMTVLMVAMPYNEAHEAEFAAAHPGRFARYASTRNLIDVLGARAPATLAA